MMSDNSEKVNYRGTSMEVTRESSEIKVVSDEFEVCVPVEQDEESKRYTAYIPDLSKRNEERVRGALIRYLDEHVSFA